MEIPINKIKIRNVNFLEKNGEVLGQENTSEASTIAITFESSKTIRDGRNQTIRFHKSGNHVICPVCRARKKLCESGKIKEHDESLSGGITASSMLSVIKQTAKDFNEQSDYYALHSIRIGGATALFEAGHAAVVIKLAGRWSSMCSELYTRLSSMLKSAAMGMVWRWEFRVSINRLFYPRVLGFLADRYQTSCLLLVNRSSYRSSYRDATSATIMLSGSKNDQYGRGAQRTMNKSGNETICPVAGLRHIRKASKHLGYTAALTGDIRSQELSNAIKGAAIINGFALEVRRPSSPLNFLDDGSLPLKVDLIN